TAVKKIVYEYGFQVCCISSPFYKCDMKSETEVQAHLEGLKRCVEACHIWDTDMIRGFTFWKESQPVKADVLAEYFAPAIEILKDGGITLVLESEPACNVCDIPGQKALIEVIDSPYVAALYDPGNEIVTLGTEPPYPQGLQILRKYIKHVHIKDMKRCRNGEMLPALIGEGDVDFHGIIETLKKDGYDGCLSVETHYRVKEKMNDDLLVRPQGSGFSDGGYEASKMYLEILRDKYNWMEK
ncbi:MAG: sugar phosphate isomerase/epimerase, partial [Firmicutes bacterium]|nr:sugar phosphate isomerase/epimerase [Bacillota bacterium]